jgi:hypothetical protein
VSGTFVCVPGTSPRRVVLPRWPSQTPPPAFPANDSLPAKKLSARPSTHSHRTCTLVLTTRYPWKAGKNAPVFRRRGSPRAGPRPVNTAPTPVLRLAAGLSRCLLRLRARRRTRPGLFDCGRVQRFENKNKRVLMILLASHLKDCIESQCFPIDKV